MPQQPISPSDLTIHFRLTIIFQIGKVFLALQVVKFNVDSGVRRGTDIDNARWCARLQGIEQQLGETKTFLFKIVGSAHAFTCILAYHRLFAFREEWTPIKLKNTIKQGKWQGFWGLATRSIFSFLTGSVILRASWSRERIN